jgi:hypothetical protein
MPTLAVGQCGLSRHDRIRIVPYRPHSCIVGKRICTGADTGVLLLFHFTSPRIGNG